MRQKRRLAIIFEVELLQGGDAGTVVNQAILTSGNPLGDVLFGVDNTFLSPAWQRPLELGADIVVHSTTKYINGHSDIVGGAVVAKTPELHEQLAWWANALGLTAGAFDSFLTLRGLRTLEARLAVHGRNAGELATWLSQQPGIRKVYYPGLPDHPGHDIAKRQQSGFGAMLSLELRGGEAAVRAFVEANGDYADIVAA